MSGHSQPFSQGNVSFRPLHRNTMNYQSPRSGSAQAGPAAFDEDLESLLPLETESSSGRDANSGRDGHGRDAGKAGSANQKDR